MSSSKRQKKREKKAPMPMQSAGLLRFFEEETRGVKVRPEIVMILTVALVVFAILLKMGILPGLPP